MKKMMTAWCVATLIAAGSAYLSAQGNSAQHAPILVPDSSVVRPEDLGIRAHTNHLIRIDGATPNATPGGQSPANLWALYNIPAGAVGSGLIVIVDAFHYPTALNDFNVFARQFGLPQETSGSATSSTNSVFQVVYASGNKPRSNCGWAQEMALDIEWAHAMAPGAKIVLVEGASNSFANLFQAVDVASSLASGGSVGPRQVSMSWGGSEFTGESSYDSHMTTTGVVYLASSGDTGGVSIYPSVSPNVIAAGGTSITFSGGVAVGETGWSGSGGGTSAYEARPSYQNVLVNLGLAGAHRVVPDFSFDADPNTGVAVYDSTSCQGLSGWLVFGGTSVASPSLSGILNLAATLNAQFPSSTAAEQSVLYGNIGSNGTINGQNIRDILSGTAGSFSAKAGWDMVTGLGSNLGLSGK